MENIKRLREDVKMIVDTADIDVLEKVYVLLKEQEYDFWDELPDGVKADVEEAFLQSEEGKGKPHNSVMKKYKRWLSK